MVKRVQGRTGVVATVSTATLLAAGAAVFSLSLGHYVAWVVWALLATALLVAGACLWTGQHPLHSRAFLAKKEREFIRAVQPGVDPDTVTLHR